MRRLVEYVARTIGNVYKILFGKPEEKSLGIVVGEYF
jgi:hypothetical protein